MTTDNTLPNPNKSGKIKLISLYFLVALFTFVGVMHFVKTQSFVQAMPDFIPSKELVVQITGVLEIAGAAGLLIPRLRRITGICLTLFLVSVFPVNLNMAMHPNEFPAIPAYALWLRLPMQGLFIWMAMKVSTYRGPLISTPKPVDETLP